VVDLRRKRSLDSIVMKLEFMAPVWRKDEDGHSTLLALPCMETCKSWLSSHRTTGPSFEDLACAVKCFIQGDSFGTRRKKMRISQRLFIRF
jgi:hypothetical protein